MESQYQYQQYSDGIAVPTYPQWIPPTVNFDLLTETTKSINVPLITMSPAGAYTMLWTVKRVSDDLDLTVSFNTYFAITNDGTYD